MASRISEAFDKAKGPLLVPYLTAGWPGIGDTASLMAELEVGGAGIIELGVPFSDPSADGTVIQRANEQALANGSGLATALGAAASYRDKGGALPVVLMGYANPFMRMGAEKLAKESARCGVDGIIAVDWPPGKSDGLGDALSSAGLDRIVLVSPTTTEGRMAEIGKHGTGYAYYVSMQGVTGGSSTDLGSVIEFAPKVRKATRLPVAVGFGIRTPADCAKLGEAFDAVVVGTRLLEAIHDAGSKAAKAARELVSSMTKAMG